VDSRLSDRSARKREAILEVATELFLTREYAGTSMEDVASAASVSKQTVYKHFSDKQTLFREVALGSVGHIGSDFQAEIAAAAEATDVRAALQTLARKYHDSGPRRTIGALAAAFARLADRGELVIDDLQVAATQFAFLVIGEPLDTAMFRGVGRGRSRRDLNALADAGVEVFLAAYGTKLSSVTR